MSVTSSPPATAREAFERGAAWARSLYRANYDGSTQRVDTNATTTAPASPPPSSYRIVGGAEVDPERTYPWMTTFKLLHNFHPTPLKEPARTPLVTLSRAPRKCTS